jgi:hypothetical protein
MHRSVNGHLSLFLDVNLLQWRRSSNFPPFSTAAMSAAMRHDLGDHHQVVEVRAAAFHKCVVTRFVKGSLFAWGTSACFVFASVCWVHYHR